jgi:hypothetical protein
MVSKTKHSDIDVGDFWSPPDGIFALFVLDGQV